MAFYGCNFYATAWVVTGLLTFLLPLIYRNMRVNDFRQLNQMYNWDEQWNEYREQQEQMYQYNNGGYWQNGANGGGAQNNYYQQYGQQYNNNYDLNNCKWWQLNCFPYYYNADGGEPDPQMGWYPSWFSGWAQSEEQREMMMENGAVSPAMRFVYVWQILMFLVILGYGVLVFRQARPVIGLMVALAVFANMCFLAMWWLADGSIVTDAEYVQKTGFYGQFAVLMFMTNAAYVIFGLVHTGLLFWYHHSMEEDKERSANGELNQHPTFRHDETNKKIDPSGPNGWTVIE